MLPAMVNSMTIDQVLLDDVQAGLERGAKVDGTEALVKDAAAAAASAAATLVAS